MAATTQDDRGLWPVWLFRLLRSRVVYGATALIFFLLSALDLLSPLGALIGFVLVSIATAIAVRGEADDDTLPNAPATTGSGESFIENVLAAIPDPIVALGQRGEVIAFNPRAGALAPGLRRGEPISLAMRAPDLLEAIRRTRAGGTSQRVEISERVPLDRRYEIVVSPIAALAGAPDRPGMVLMTFHDLTALRQVEEMRADFVANASHELRTPLAALLGFIETLQGPARDDPAARERFLGIMQAQATRMARLIDDLLSLSRIELNAHKRPATPVDLNAVLRQVADGLQVLARDREVTINLSPSAVPAVVAGDRDELTRLFENLVENALKYGATGKRVDLTFARGTAPAGGEEVIVSVRDYGPGIAPDHLPRLTERFYRVDVAESRAQGGTGLGLALVKHILNRHGGRLNVESVQGEGATFKVHLPLLKVEIQSEISKA